MKISQIVYLLIVCIFFSCSSANKATVENTYGIEGDVPVDVKLKQDSLAFELCEIYGLDQGIRNSPGFKGKGKLISVVDSVNFAKIVAFIEKYGVPNVALVGEQNFCHECVQTAWVAVLLHNPHRLVNEDKYLDFFAALMHDGQIKEETLVCILDKYYWAKSGGKDVLYGSQFGKPCIQHKVGTNRARKRIGLSALPDSLFKDCPK